MKVEVVARRYSGSKAPDDFAVCAQVLDPAFDPVESGFKAGAALPFVPLRWLVVSVHKTSKEAQQSAKEYAKRK